MGELKESVWAQRRGHSDRKGDWMETASGQKFWPLDARPEEVSLDDIAHHLARIGRYNGAIKIERYTVGEHACVMADWFLRTHPDSPHLAYQALHHDDCEAYIGDMVRPLKRNMPNFVEIEDELWRSAIAPALGLPAELDVVIKEADSRILIDEREQVVGKSSNDWGLDHLEPLGVQLTGWGPSYTKGRYLWLHERLRELIAL